MQYDHSFLGRPSSKELEEQEFAYQRRLLRQLHDYKISNENLEIPPFILKIEGKLFLKVNRKKTEVAHISKVKYLGYAFYRYKGKCRFRVHPKSVAKMKNRIRELTDINKGISNEIREKEYQEYVRGWVEYIERISLL